MVVRAAIALYGVPGGAWGIDYYVRSDACGMVVWSIGCTHTALSLRLGNSGYLGSESTSYYNTTPCQRIYLWLIFAFGQLQDQT